MRASMMWLVAGLLVAGVAHGAETGTALKTDDIKAEPFRDAKTVGSLGKGDAVEILATKSGWMQVKVRGKQGWVRMLSVRKGAAGKRDAGKEAEGIAGLATGRAGTGQVVSATGVRGLSEADLKEAKFNEEDLRKAESNRVSAQAAQTFAQAGPLAARQIAFLPESSSGSSSGAAGGRQ